MKILIAADIFPPEAGGPATYAAALAKALPANGVETAVVSLNPNSKVQVTDYPLAKVRFGGKILRYGEFFLLLLSQAVKGDLIYAMGPVNSGLPAWLVSRLVGKKMAVKVVGDYAWEQGNIRFGVT
ncbi:MAG: hypothetical protein HY979_02100, partial [Candidatus Magasanikbacteria bacterium]|nr:hypothetical protein [Candidatus Magasanikbacteria bacterium]